MPSSAPDKVIRPCPRPFSDHISATVNGVDIPLRIFPAGPSAVGGKKKRPWLMWIHGGGFVAGKHYLPNNWVHPAFHHMGIHIVSVGYRFIPQVSLPELVQDISRSYEWCRRNLPSVLGENAVELDSWFVGGDSAGGHLATLVALGGGGGDGDGNWKAQFQPGPKVVLDLYGFVDLTDPYMSTPSKDPLSPNHNTPLDVLQRAARDYDPANAQTVIAWTWEMEPNMSPGALSAFWGVDYLPSKLDREKLDLEHYYTNTGTRMHAMFRHEPHGESDHTRSGGAEGASGEEKEAQFERLKREWSPAHLIREYKGQYPPTVVMHGTADTVVPPQQSVGFAEDLERIGTEVLKIWCEGGGHCFDQVITGPESTGWQEYIIPCLNFVKMHLDL